MGFIDLPNISEDHICDVKYEMKNILIKPNNVEEHSIYVEAEIEVFCEAYENRNISMIQDLYSPKTNLCFKQRNISPYDYLEVGDIIDVYVIEIDKERNRVSLSLYL